MASRPSVVIVGGGIGGLFAANALIAQGLHVAVHEQAPALGEIGAGVFVTPNAVRHLERVGLGPAVVRWGARVGPEQMAAEIREEFRRVSTMTRKTGLVK